MSDHTSADASLLEVRDLRKTFRVPGAGKKRLCALDGITLDLKRGETLGLVGESGCGKSTLARTLMMLERPDEGSVRFDGMDLYANPGTFRSVLGCVPQDDIIRADLPLERMLRYAARLRLASSTAAADIDEAVRDALDAVAAAITSSYTVARMREEGRVTGRTRTRPSLG